MKGEKITFNIEVLANVEIRAEKSRKMFERTRPHDKQHGRELDEN
jgi:FKBP-type peptidyl-prolyl cis-trans isomerase 2